MGVIVANIGMLKSAFSFLQSAHSSNTYESNVLQLRTRGDYLIMSLQNRYAFARYGVKLDASDFFEANVDYQVLSSFINTLPDEGTVSIDDSEAERIKLDAGKIQYFISKMNFALNTTVPKPNFIGEINWEALYRLLKNSLIFVKANKTSAVEPSVRLRLVKENNDAYMEAVVFQGSLMTVFRYDGSELKDFTEGFDVHLPVSVLKNMAGIDSTKVKLAVQKYNNDQMFILTTNSGQLFIISLNQVDSSGKIMERVSNTQWPYQVTLSRELFRNAIDRISSIGNTSFKLVVDSDNEAVIYSNGYTGGGKEYLKIENRSGAFTMQMESSILRLITRLNAKEENFQVRSTDQLAACYITEVDSDIPEIKYNIIFSSIENGGSGENENQEEQSG